LAQPSNFSTEYSLTAKTTGEGSTAMGFYNVQQGDAPYFKYLADHYSHERQLSSVGDGRYRREPHHAGDGRRDLVQRWEW
jgi:hypothetical protein